MKRSSFIGRPSASCGLTETCRWKNKRSNFRLDEALKLHRTSLSLVRSQTNRNGHAQSIIQHKNSA
jgi:hypothetical protein